MENNQEISYGFMGVFPTRFFHCKIHDQWYAADEGCFCSGCYPLRARIIKIAATIMAIIIAGGWFGFWAWALFIAAPKGG